MRNLVFDKDTCQKSEITESNSDNFPVASRPCEIADLRRALRDKIHQNEIFCSLEIVSTRKPNGFYQSLLEELDKYSPLFYALTWHEEAAVGKRNYLPLNLAEDFPPNTLLHLAARSFKRDEMSDVLRKALAAGIINIFALRGDSLSEDGDFEHAADLVAFIREQYGETFCICVAGYPEMHPESPSKELDLHYLKAKVDAGADFIITQMCFESQLIINFVNDCRRIGIQAPIIPGILLPASHDCLERMAQICKVHVPVKIKDDLSRMKDNDKATTELVIDLAARIMADVIKSGAARGFHLFMLNRSSLMAGIYKRVDLLKMHLGSSM